MARRLPALVLAFLISWIGVFPSLTYANTPETAKVVNRWCLDIINVPIDPPPVAGQNPVKVAVIDSGVWTNNPYIELMAIEEGYNYALKNSVTHDLIGHGSQIVALVAGAKAEDRELVGLGSHTRIVPLVWITKYPSGVAANGGVAALSSAIRDAVDVYGCQIINVSSGITTDEAELREAVAFAEDRGAILISAVGNKNQSDPDAVFYPAAYGTAIGVGSVGSDRTTSDFSQRNASVMVTAPGENVTSLAPDPAKVFTEVSGTSYAAAYVSGFAALLLSHHPEMTPSEFREILKDSSQDLGEPGYDTCYGYGLIDVERAMEMADGPKSQTPPFSDISGPYEEHIIYLAGRGVVTGKLATTFEPLAPVTRAEFAAMLARMSGEPLIPADDGAPGTSEESIARSVFSDVAPYDWFQPYVVWAASTGIAQGYGGMFRPYDEITRQDLVVMLARFAEHVLEGPLPPGDVTFEDAHLAAGYALPSIGRLMEAGIIGAGTENLFDPLAMATRGEAAQACALLLRMLGR